MSAPTEKDRERADELACWSDGDGLVHAPGHVIDEIAAALANAREEGRREERLARLLESYGPKEARRER